MTLDRGLAPIVGLAGFIVFSTTLLARHAAALPFWYDELLTLRLSELDSIGELWSALTAGIEFTPPLNYLATKYARLLPGPDTLTARIPALTGYVLLTMTIFVFLRRRIGAWLALAATALLPLANYTTTFAVEARPYMLVLGISGCALLCWQATLDSDRHAGRPALAPIGLSVSLALALLLHVWAILLPMAIAAGELAVTARTRMIRWRVLAAIAAATPVLAVYPAILNASSAVVFGGPVYGPSTQKLYASVRSGVPRPLVVLVAALVALAAARWARRLSARGEREGAGLLPEEMVVLIALLLSPLVPYVYAVMAEGAFMARYALFALPATVALVGAAFHRASGGNPLAGPWTAAVTLLGVLLLMPPKVPAIVSRLAVVESLTSAQSRLDPAVPIVLVNPTDVLPFDEQADDDLARRTIFVADPDLALEHTATNGIDLGYVRGARYLKLRPRLLEYGALTEYPRLYLAGKWQSLSWLPQQLERDGWRVTGIGGSAQAPLFEATRGASAARR
jgi:hypothetical protein